MTIKAIAITAFVHGSLNLRRGQEAEFSEPTFTALAAHGLVRAQEGPHAGPDDQTQTPARATRAARTPSNKRASDPLNKSTPSDAPAAGSTGETGTSDAATEEATGTQNADATSTAQASETTNGPGADDAAANT